MKRDTVNDLMADIDFPGLLLIIINFSIFKKSERTCGIPDLGSDDRCMENFTHAHSSLMLFEITLHYITR